MTNPLLPCTDAELRTLRLEAIYTHDGLTLGWIALALGGDAAARLECSEMIAGDKAVIAALAKYKADLHGLSVDRDPSPN